MVTSFQIPDSHAQALASSVYLLPKPRISLNTNLKNQFTLRSLTTMFAIECRKSKKNSLYYVLTHTKENGFKVFITFDIQVILKLVDLNVLGAMKEGEIITF